MAVLVACVGYRFLRDLSVGPVLAPILGALPWPADVEICDLHFGPIHMVHWLEERSGYYHRIVFVAAMERGREPGQIYCYRWQGVLPDPDEIQQRVCEGVTGVIDLDNLLIIGQHFGVFPADVVVVEVEPEDTGWGPGFGPRVQAAQDAIIATVQQVALHGHDGRPT